jgi:spore coat protein U domain-containing protein, fimbrial subunit CupE1/2/3/6
MKKSRAITVSALALLALAAAPKAHAGSATSSFTVSAAVVASCTISTTTLAFGNYDPIVANATSPLDVNGSVTITCTKGSTTTIGLDAGQFAANAVGTTRAMMVAGPDYLSYELYQDAGRSTLWGNSGVALFTPAAAPNKNPRSFNIYGRIPAGQGSTIGNYTDTVVATVNF